MKRLVVVFLLLMMITAIALAQDYPVYGKCTGERVNVRKTAEGKYPSRGQLIHNSPVVVIGEEGDLYLCKTFYGEGYIPKKYVELFENMTEEEFAAYEKEHPSYYRKNRHKNWDLLDEYYSGKITEEQLKEQWVKEPKTGYLGLGYDDTGYIEPFRTDWWAK
ncbi:MAG: SH3 domain-containing protein [Clostridia bacterium]|nr:SH3 domain-containing protein [Clostridia bacterium]